MHNKVAMDKFMSDHGILNDVQIESLGPNKDAKGHEDRILVSIWLIHQEDLRFFISPMLKEVMAQFCLTFM